MGERGVVLLLAIMALLVVSAVGAAILYMAASESGFVGSQRMSARAFYAGLGGLEEARYRLLPALLPVTGLNYTDPIDLDLLVAPPQIFPCTASELAGTLVPCQTSTVTPLTAPSPVGAVAASRADNVLYIMNSTAVAPAAPGANAGLPASATNDPFVVTEVPIQNVRTVATIQPGAGAATSVPYQWIRINIKTERASLQDLDLNGSVADDEPIFNYLGRQYRRADLLAFDPTGSVLPPPWGPPPAPDSGRNCGAAVCALPVYEVTTFATLPGPTPTGRVVRNEVSSATGFSINAGILSEPLIDVSGTSTYIGYDQCDPQCPPGMPDGKKDLNPYTAYAGDPGFIPLCSAVLPVQSSAPVDSSDITNNAARTYPNTCTVTSPGASNAFACIQEAAPFPYDIPTLISILRPTAINIPPGNYTGLPDGTTSMGTFPPAPYPASLVNGTGAVFQTTYVGGRFKCTAGCKGAGILIVDCPTCTAAQPALSLDGSMEFYGLIIINGPVEALGGGNPGSDCNIYGAMIASGTIETGLGGALCYRYNSCAQRDQFRNRPFGQLSFREVPE